MKYKRELTITIIVSLLICFFKITNLFQINNYTMVSMIIILSFISIKMQKMIDKNYEDNNINYDSLDILKFVAAISILIFHLRPFKDYSNIFDLIFNNIITRTCVPIFFVITGYFVAKKSKDNDKYISKYTKNMMPTYLIWSLIYVPILIGFIVQNWNTVINFIPNLQIYILIPLIIILIPLAILVILFYSGVYYHLWYFPALILALLFLDKWKKRFSIKSLLIISFILFLFGATETYYGVLPLTIRHILSYYYNIFYTTRNFLFFGLFYVTLGFYMGSKEKVYSKYCFLKLIISIFIFVAEALYLKGIKRLDGNILISCVPLTYYLFISSIYITKIKKKINFSFRDYSKYYYLIHPMIIYILLLNGVISNKVNPCIQLLLVLVITHILSKIIITLKKHHKLII